MGACVQEYAKHGGHSCPLCRATLPARCAGVRIQHPRPLGYILKACLGLVIISLVACGIASCILLSSNVEFAGSEANRPPTVGLWSRMAFSDAHGALWTSIRKSARNTDLGRFINFDTCSKADSLTGFVGCFTLSILGYIFVWSFCVLVGASIGLPFVVWQLSSKYGASVASRMVFVLLGSLLNAVYLLILFAITITLGGLCFAGADRFARPTNHRALGGGRRGRALRS